MRDNITRITKAVTDIRAIRKQINLHDELLGKAAGARALLKQEKELAGKLDELEAKNKAAIDEAVEFAKTSPVPAASEL